MVHVCGDVEEGQGRNVCVCVCVCVAVDRGKDQGRNSKRYNWRNKQ